MHINFRRGETRSFVFQREHMGSSGWCQYYNSKRDSGRYYKTELNRTLRRHLRWALQRDWEDPVPVKRNLLDRVRWLRG